METRGARPASAREPERSPGIGTEGELQTSWRIPPRHILQFSFMRVRAGSFCSTATVSYQPRSFKRKDRKGSHDVRPIEGATSIAPVLSRKSSIFGNFVFASGAGDTAENARAQAADRESRRHGPAGVYGRPAPRRVCRSRLTDDASLHPERRLEAQTVLLTSGDPGPEDLRKTSIRERVRGSGVLEDSS